ncbi:MAG: exodeoxyribonuclease VII small subunit [Sinobacterium sp.]|nr:exodeoxyribonuclease VII small subunit [Sinobacterium sp.]
MPTKKKISFEASLDTLNKTVKAMESGDLSLEDSLTSFEKGIALVRECQESLDKAEQKVEKLIAKQDGFDTVAFSEDA